MIQTSVGNSLAAITGFWFVGSLHLRLTARGPSTAAWAAFGGGVAMVTLLLAGSAIRSAAVIGSLAGDPQTAKTPWVLQEGFSVWFGAPLIVFMLGGGLSGPVWPPILPDMGGWQCRSVGCPMRFIAMAVLLLAAAGCSGNTGALPPDVAALTAEPRGAITFAEFADAPNDRTGEVWTLTGVVDDYLSSPDRFYGEVPGPWLIFKLNSPLASALVPGEAVRITCRLVGPRTNADLSWVEADSCRDVEVLE